MSDGFFGVYDRGISSFAGTVSSFDLEWFAVGVPRREEQRGSAGLLILRISIRLTSQHITDSPNSPWVQPVSR